MGALHAQQVAALARAGRWWEVAAAVATATVDDPDLLMLAARAWTALGVPTLATETLDRLCSAFPAAERHEGVSACRAGLTGQSDREIPAADLAARVRAAADALAAAGLDVADHADRWMTANAGTRVFIARDGNCVRRRETGALELIGDHRAASRSLIEQHKAALEQSPAPIIIEGMDPPWLALELHAATAGEGYTPGLRIVQADAIELLDGCSLAQSDELFHLIESDRVEWFVGDSAPTQLSAAIADEPGVRHDGPVVPLATLRTRVSPTLAEAVQAASRRHAETHAACVATVRERDRTSATISRVQAVAGGTPRVALVAGRFTTVLRPMVEDLAQSFRAMGATTRIITEPNDHRRLTALAYSRAFADFDPDLIVCANYTRDDADRLVGEQVMPRGVRWVTWVQDAMPHLLRTNAGRAIGPIDLAIGHITPTMRADLGYADDRSISAPMVASETKFSPERVDSALAGELACEIAAFTNHSESPNAMRSRLIDEVSNSPAAAAVVKHIADAALALADEPIERTLGWRRCRAIVDQTAPDADPETRENLFQNIAFRVYDRACRHRALAWARDVAERNGWRLAIYGRGWDDHPTLAAHARGTIEHGTPICSAYAAARVTLDATVLTSLHQRIAECALAGGLPSVVVTGSMLAMARGRLKRRILSSVAGDAVPAPDLPGQVAVPLYRAPQGERFTRLGSLLNGRSFPYLFVDPKQLSAPEPPGMIDTDDAVDVLELGVWSPASLERLVRRAGDPAWRDAQRSRVCSYVREHCTHRVLARRIIDHYASLAKADAVAA